MIRFAFFEKCTTGPCFPPVWLHGDFVDKITRCYIRNSCMHVCFILITGLSENLGKGKKLYFRSVVLKIWFVGLWDSLRTLRDSSGSQAGQNYFHSKRLCALFTLLTCALTVHKHGGKTAASTL